MSIICAWCRETTGETKGRENTVVFVLCDVCRKEASNQNWNLSEFIAEYNRPIVMVDSEGKIKGANAAATAFLKKPLPELLGLPGGDAFNCAYASLPEGCGNTQHCYACMVRRSVMATHGTGKPVCHKKVLFNMRQGATIIQAKLTISTCLCEGIVYLWIEPDNQK